MANPQVLAHNHMAQQVTAATATQAALAVTFDRRLKPSALDDTFASYLQGALALIAVGRDSAAATATAYYGAAKVNAGFEAIIPKLATPKLNVEKVAQDLLVNGPVAIKKQLSSGVSMTRAVEVAKLRTLGVGKRHVLDGARETVIGLSRKDRDALGWARVSDGAPCSFCGMLVSRGPVYSEGTVHFKSHNHCGCSARPYFRGEADGGWSPDALELRRLWMGDPDWHPGKVYPPGKAPKRIDPTEWRGLYNATLADVDSPLSKVLTEKLAGRISTQLATVARSTAEAAIAAAATVETPLWQAKVAAIAERMKGRDLDTLGVRTVTPDRAKLVEEWVEQYVDGDFEPRAILSTIAKFDVFDTDKYPTALVLKQVRESLDARESALADLVGRWDRWKASGGPLPRTLSQDAAKALNLKQTRLRAISREDLEYLVSVARVTLDEDLHALKRAEAKREAAVVRAHATLDANPDLVKVRAVKVDDVDELGAPAKAVQETLDDVLAAGKALDEEIERVVEARLGPSPAAQLAELRRRHKALTEERDSYSLANGTAPRPASTREIQERRARIEEISTLRAELGTQIMDAETALVEWHKSYAAIVREKLGEVRPVGGGARPVYKKGTPRPEDELPDRYDVRPQEALERAMEHAHSSYPSAWNDLAASKNPEVGLFQTTRGYNSGGRNIALSRDWRRASDGFDGLADVATHELGHSMEWAVPGLRAMEWAYHYRRTDKVIGPDGRPRLADAFELYGGDIGMGSELARPDAWATNYTGKVYNVVDRPGAESLWEVFTTGVESLVDGSPYFRRGGSLGDDAEFRQFILGALSVL